MASGFQALYTFFSNHLIDEQNGDGSKDIKKIDDARVKKEGLDPHKIKEDELGKTGDNSKYDLYLNNKTKEIEIYFKGGKGDGIKTGKYIKQ